ncbi:MAG: hypothetical protein WCA07_08800 [Gloeobacterales cyanobacterium]
MSKRSKRSSGSRGFGKQEQEMLMESEALVGFAVTVFALQLAAQKLAVLEPSKTVHEWEKSLIKEATEQVFASETVELVEGVAELQESLDLND